MPHSYQTTNVDDPEDAGFTVEAIPAARSKDPAMPWKISTAVLAAVASMAIIVAAFSGSSNPESVTNTPTTTATNLVGDIGAERVDGYTCGNVQIGPCEIAGGNARCEGFLSKTCTCNTGFSAIGCDWGPPQEPAQVPAYMHQESKPEEDLKRIQMAYDYSNAIYLNDQDRLRSDCPDIFKSEYARNWGILREQSDGAYTHAGAVDVISSDLSPSGKAEALFAFRGTEFTGAGNEISACLASGFDDCQLAAVKTVTTDANINKKDLSWPKPDGRNISLGYVHEGFYLAVAPFLEPLLSNATRYIEAASTDDGPAIINVVGHSLGGALANLFASVLRVVVPEARIYLTTFGAPRVGSAKWVSLLESDSKFHILRVVAGDDVVSLVPTWLGLDLDTIGSSVMHAGPQLTLGWQTVSSECKDSGIIDIKNQLDLITNSRQRTCAIDSISGYHTDYYPHIGAYMRKAGLKSQPWCVRKVNF